MSNAFSRLVLVVALLHASPGWSQLPSPKPTTLPDTDQYVIESEKIGQTFEINVWSSQSDPAKPNAVIYVTDGLALFALLQSTIRMMQLSEELPAVTLVGIGYRSDMPVMQVLATRQRELTPTQNPGDDLPDSAALAGGGADAFLAFIEHRVKPLIYERYTVNQNDETLVGHSLGGLFSLYAFLSHPDMFDRYLASSPSLWWDSEFLFKLEKQSRKENAALQRRLFLSVGEQEGEGGVYDMVGNMHAMAKILSGKHYPALKVTSHEFPAETHQSVIPAAYSRGMRVLFSD